MSIALRLFLFFSAVLVLFFVIRKLKKSEFEVSDSIFWLAFILILIILAIFPQIAFTFSDLLGFESPSNLIFLAIIAILLIRTFSLNAKVANLRTKLNCLIQEAAIKNNSKH